MSFGFGSIDHQANGALGAAAQESARAVTALALRDPIARAAGPLAAPAASVAGPNVAETSTELDHLVTRGQASLETLRNANTQFGFLNRFLNTSS